MSNLIHTRPPRKYILAADCETDPFEVGVFPKPFIWGVYDGYADDYWEFSGPRCTDDFLDFIAERDARVYAHNGGKFDWHFCTHRLEKGQELMIIAGRLARFSIGKADCRDSMNLMPVALAQYQKQVFDYNKLHKAVRHQYMDEIREYLKSDCVNLWNMLFRFEQEYGQHLTQASGALKIWSQMTGHNPPKTSPVFYDEFKPYYYGGRVQCFKTGVIKADAAGYDINSAYPTAMLEKHPFSPTYSIGEGTPKIPVSKWGPMFFNVIAISKGAFPYRGIDGSLYYPDDGEAREYHVTGWELLAALETDTAEILEVLEWRQFDGLIDFQDYVYHFWEKRKEAKREGDKGKDFYCKIFLNGLYGKFAANPESYRNYTLHFKEELADIELEPKQNFAFFNDWLLISDPLPAPKRRYYNLATGASITGWVRAFLWRHICQVDEPIYCDTDSITGIGFNDFKLGSELGEWGIEGEYDSVAVAGKKLYAFHKRDGSGYKVASKGARLKPEEILRIAGGEAITFTPEVPTYSIHRDGPRFIDRRISATGADIRTVPRHNDPKYSEGDEP